jgi:hypothetical protein
MVIIDRRIIARIGTPISETKVQNISIGFIHKFENSISEDVT